MTEQQMVQDILTADKAAFEEFYRLHKKSLLHTCWCFLGNDAEAEQAAEKTFALAIRQMGRFQFQCSLETWLDHLAAGLCRRTIEKNKKHLLNSIDFFVPDPQPRSKPAYPEEVLKLLREEIEKLEGDKKELLALREFKGLPYEVVANRSKKPVGVVLYEIFHIRRELMDRVKTRMAAQEQNP